MASGGAADPTLARLRRTAGLTQRQLAEAAGVSVGTVRDIEQGRTVRPRPAARAGLAAALGVPPDALDERPTTRSLHRIGVLGPLELTVGGRPVRLPSTAQSCLLGRLALEADRFVPVEVLADMLWDGAPPAGWRSLLHSHAARLRRVWTDVGPGAPVVEGERGRYRLVAHDCEIDAAAFLADLEARDGQPPDVALDLAVRALGRWRGPVLADLPDLGTARLGRRLTGQRRRCMIELADLALQLGDPVPALAELIPAAADDPLDEVLAERTIRLLSLRGRYAEAMTTFDRSRRALRDELGLDPGPELRTAYTDALAASGTDRSPLAPHGPVAQRRPRGPAQLPRRLADFVGREAELSRITTALDPTGGGSGVCVVTGLGGMGKTSLAVEAGHRVRQQFGGGQLFVDLRGHGPDPIDAERALELLLLGLGTDRFAVPVDLNERIALFRTITADLRLLIMLDNVPDGADIGMLVPGGGQCATVITARQRPDGTDGAVHIEVPRLSVAESERLLRACAGSRPSGTDQDWVGELAQLCGGLPLALRLGAGRLEGAHAVEPAELIRQLKQGVTSEVLTAGRRSLAATFEVGLRALPDDDARTARLLASVGLVDFDARDAAEVSGAGAAGTGPAGEALDRLAARSIVQAPVDGRYSLHDLMRDFLAARSVETDGVAGGRAALLRWARYATRCADLAFAVLVPHRVARPDAARPATVDEPSDTTTSGVGSSDTVSEPSDTEGAHRWLSAQAANLTVVAPALCASDPAAGWRLADSAGVLFRVREDAAGWADVARAGMDAARAAGEVVGESLMHDALARVAALRGRSADALHHYREGLALAERIGWERARVALQTNVSIGFEAVDDRPAARAAARAAITLADAAGMPYFHAAALNQLGNLARADGDLTTARAMFEQSLEISIRLPDEWGIAVKRGNIAEILWLTGQTDEAIRILRELERSPVVRASTMLRIEYGVDLGLYLLTRGYVREAATHIARGWDLARTIEHDGLRALALTGRGLVSNMLGDRITARIQLERAAAMARAADDREVELTALLCRVHVEFDGGDLTAAERVAVAATRRADAANNPIMAGRFLLARARLAEGRGDDSLAGRMRSEAERHLAGTGFRESRGERRSVPMNSARTPDAGG